MIGWFESNALGRLWKGAVVFAYYECIDICLEAPKRSQHLQ
jgi:hypothetical protein